jgi:two-component system LytT family sensor kinase
MTRDGTNRRSGVTNGFCILDASAATVDSSPVPRPSQQIRLSWIFGVATGLGAFSTLIAFSFRFFFAGTKTPYPALVALNFSYWYSWAVLVPAILWVARRYPFERQTWGRAVAAHVPGVVVFTVAHAVLATACRFFTRWVFNGPGTDSFWWVLRNEYFFNFDFSMMTYWFLIGLSQAIDYRRQSAARALTAAHLEARLAEASLQALQRQLHPHFLFNTLHTISALIHRDAHAADAMLARLSDLLRLTLDRVGTQQLQLKEELDFIEKYLEIEHTRFGERLRVVFDIDPAVLDAAVPSLVLQPLVENALRHGIGPKVSGGRIEIVARRDTGGQLALIVRDDGYGVPHHELEALNEGVGVSNTRSRLALLYGERHRFEFRTPAGGGLEVTVAIPLTMLPEAAGPTAMESVA